MTDTLIARQRLFEFQRTGVDFLKRSRRAYLADEMGLGKTVQAIMAARVVGVRNALVIAPASALENWRREWGQWGPKGATFAAVSYAGRDELAGSDWDLVIVDEAHYAKNRQAKRTLRALAAARGAGRAWLLSATPMPNHPGELWAPIRALWPEIPRELGIARYSEWFNTFCLWTRTRYGPRVYGTKNLELLRPHLQRIMLRRTLDDVALELPPLRVDVSLLPRDGEFEKALEEVASSKELEALKQGIAYEEGHPCPKCDGSGRGKYACSACGGKGADAHGDCLACGGSGRDDCANCNGTGTEKGSSSRLRRLLGEYKAPRIADLLKEELSERQYDKIVVLYYHRAVGDVLRKKLSRFDVVGFDGSTPQPKRQQAIDEFTNGTARVFLAQQTAAGIAINLQVAREIVLVEPAWTPDENAQAIKRVHRIGSKHPVRARVFAVAGSLDEGVMRTAANKVRMQTAAGLKPAAA